MIEMRLIGAGQIFWQVWKWTKAISAVSWPYIRALSGGGVGADFRRPQLVPFKESRLCLTALELGLQLQQPAEIGGRRLAIDRHALTVL